MLFFGTFYYKRVNKFLLVCAFLVFTFFWGGGVGGRGHLLGIVKKLDYNGSIPMYFL